MARADVRALRFVRALLPDHAARIENGSYSVERTDRVARLDRGAAAELAGAGVLMLSEAICVAGPRARDWLAAEGRGKRDLPPEAAPDVAPSVLYSLDESPLARLAVARDGEVAFLLAHQVAAGERVRKLVERARLSPRMTMSYDANRIAGGGGPAAANDLSDSAVDARRKLDAVAALLPADCRGVVFDVCGLLKGLQTVETERGWPRRSAKMVLRIGLEQLAVYWGLSAHARGNESGRVGGWLEARLPLFGD
ncbi:hypothetical protein ABIB57_000689 [Devosia sp. UYZn731]|uniref:DUF6456 domain-containing protein n=1 Tax=Devosia sp. UYZn731 TaxID=3156345 RepID=UPI0033999120